MVHGKRLMWFVLIAVALLVCTYIVFKTTEMSSIIPKSSEDYTTKEPEMKQVKISVIGNTYEWFNYVDIPRMRGVNNKARIGHGECVPERKHNNSESLKTVVLTNYIPVDQLRDKHSIYNRPATREEEEARIAEILSCYEANLKHPLVKTMYIFVQFPQSMEFLRSIDFKNSEKLVIQWVNKTILVKDTLLYASDCLLGHIVTLLHQDNRLGAGFDKIHPNILIDNKLMYAITRQPAYEHYCSHSLSGATCSHHTGSHDAFMFHVKGFTEKDLNIISDTKVEGNELGMENIVVWVFQTKLGYKVLNPCKVLHIHHEHCVPIRKSTRRRVNYQHRLILDSSDKLT